MQCKSFFVSAKFKAPAKRSQHFNSTNLNIVVGSAFASSGQTIATFECSISQHCWAQHVHPFGHPVATTTSCNIYKLDKKDLTVSNLSQQHPTPHNMLQHVATGLPNSHNMLLTTKLPYAAMNCCDRLAGA